MQLTGKNWQTKFLKEKQSNPLLNLG